MVLKTLIAGVVANSFAYEYSMGRRFHQKSSTIPYFQKRHFPLREVSFLL